MMMSFAQQEEIIVINLVCLLLKDRMLRTCHAKGYAEIKAFFNHPRSSFSNYGFPLLTEEWEFRGRLKE
jgi:hypothetical protein